MFYVPTNLEKKIAEIYQDINITKPEQINIQYICEKYNILYYEKPIFSHYIIINDTKIIIIDSRLDIVQKREQFFHELGHVFFHEGLQTSLPKNSNYFQEADANNFCKYAIIPYHMLDYIDFHSDDIVYDIINTFEISKEMAMKRINDIKNKTLNQNVININTV